MATTVSETPAHVLTTSRPDTSGRDRLAKNVLASWAGQLVFIVAGFMMPRLIDQRLGQVSLGIWDFAWSVLTYLVLADVGVGSSVNRYVAKYRATGESTRLREAVASVHAIQFTAALLAVMVTATLAWFLPLLIGRHVDDLSAARWVIVLLGTSMAAQTAFNAYGGILTGCHRWDTHNAITAGSYALIVCGMAIALLCGGGLPAMSVTYFAGTIGGELTRRHFALRYCPELRVSLRLANWPDVRMLFAFGGKTVVDNLGRMLVAQANSLLVAMYLGPAALAVYARPMALARIADTLTNKFGMVFVPATSSLVGQGRTDEIRSLFIESTRLATFLAMPITLFLAVMGDPIMQLWMGPRYHEGLLVATVALGNFFILAQRPSAHILTGMNAHGRVGWASLAVACVGVALAIVVMGPFHGGLVAAALSLVVPTSIGNGLFLMIYTCRMVGVPVKKYVRSVFTAPAACAIPHVIALAAIRVVWGDDPVMALGLGATASVLVLTPLYWRFALSVDMRRAVVERVPAPIARLLERIEPHHTSTQSPVLSVESDQRTHVSSIDQAAAATPIRPFPYPYKAALAICSDLDLTPNRHVYLETTKFLNTTESTSMGPGVGLEVGNTIYFDMDPDQFAYWNTDDAGRDMVRSLIRSGHIDCLHSFGDLATTRSHAARSLEDLARHDCRLEVWIDHAIAPTNFGADIMRGHGDLPSSPAYHADLTCDAGVRFVWRGRVTSMIGQEAPSSLGGIWQASHPVESTATVGKEAIKGLLASSAHAKYRLHAANRLLAEATLRDGRSVYEFIRSNPHYGGVSRGDTAIGLPDVLTERMLQRLIARGAMSVIYTHLGKTRSPHEPFDAAARDALRRLAHMRDRGDLLVTTTRRLLGYAAMRGRVDVQQSTRDGCTHVHVKVQRDDARPMTSKDLDGLTVYVSDSHRARVFVDGREIEHLQRHPADDTGRQSVMIPWNPLEFPSL
jgi:O-antigen/teichoic acid export membrane protein